MQDFVHPQYAYIEPGDSLKPKVVIQGAGFGTRIAGVSRRVEATRRCSGTTGSTSAPGAQGADESDDQNLSLLAAGGSSGFHVGFTSVSFSCCPLVSPDCRMPDSDSSFSMEPRMFGLAETKSIQPVLRVQFSDLRHTQLILLQLVGLFT